jgi:nitrate/nitrite transporter NarK
VKENKMRPSIIGVASGFALGFAGAFGGFGAFVLVAVLGAAGLVAGLAVEGKIDLNPDRRGRGRVGR